MSRAELPEELFAIWPNCTVPDCGNKACIGLSNDVCFPHHFRLRMDSEGNALYPDEATRIRLQKILSDALDKLRTEEPTR